MKISHIITKDSATVNFDGNTHTIMRSDGVFPALIQAIKDKNEAQIRTCCSRAAFINQKSEGMFKVVDNQLFVDGQQVFGDLGERIIAFIDEELPFEPLLKFCGNVRKNPDPRAVLALFSFLEANKHPITEDGNFIAYKRVHAPNENGVMLDIYSKTFDNRPGSVLEMPRDQVNSDPMETCSRGLHVSNWDYANNHFHAGEGKLIQCEISPADVVAIPLDYDQAKMRVCKYTVLSLVANPNPEKLLVRSDRLDNLKTANEIAESEEEDDSIEEDEELCDACGETTEDCTGEYEDCVSPVVDDESDDESYASNYDSDEDIVIHSEKNLRKMNTTRILAYKDTLDNLQRPTQESIETLKIVNAILTGRLK